MSVDAEALAADLGSRLEGEVRFDDGSRAMYSTDASNYRQVPIGVVVPRSVDDVVATVATCRDHRAPVLSRGGGTSLAGQCCNVAVVIDWSKYLHGLVSLDPQARRAVVQPGCVLDDLRAAAHPHRLTFGPDPATHNHCTLGGMIGNDSCGVHSVVSGRTVDNVASLEVLTYDGLRMRVGPTSDEELSAIVARGGRRGEIYDRLRALRDAYADEIRARYPDIPRRVSGYNLDELLPEKGFNVARALVGTEGTCVTVLEAELELIHDPPVKSLLVMGYPDMGAAGDHVPEVMKAGPRGLEGFDRKLVDLTEDKGLHPEALSLLPPGGAWLLCEFGGESKEESDSSAHDLMARLRKGRTCPSMKLFDDPAEEKKVWEVRESGLGVSAHEREMKKNSWPGFEDAAVPPARLGDYVRDLRTLFDRYGYDGSLYGHFGQGCIHTRINFDLRTAAGIAHWRSFMSEGADLVVSYGGSISGEHGDGQARAELLPKMFGDDLVRAFGEFKAIWDPDDDMNPGKVVRPNPITGQLRLGTSYEPWEPVTLFRFPDDDASFARAALRCVGVGECRREGGGTMCPSYMVTREEKDSTRGRARLLFEMLQGDVITDGWRSEAVHEALDLCLACKGCKSDCPVNVDMATYKAEFLAHHYEGRLRPAAHYSMGWLPLVARAASRGPRVVNALAHAPGMGSAIKQAGGVALERDLPRFAPQTLREWFAARSGSTSGGPEVLVWPDTFTNHFHPSVGRAAVEVLEDAGFRVVLPEEPLCCGLTWISTGQLKKARRVLTGTIAALRDRIRAGVPLVGLEPSCTAVFRNDLGDLFPHDEDAKRLRAQTWTLGELLGQHAGDWAAPRLERQAIVQGHCHHKAIMGMGPEMKLLERAGIDARLLGSGCCGLAGNFGFEAGHYDVSIACGERVLLPAVRQASPDTIVVADGFSCRTQISHATDRRALHTAQVMALALHQGEPGAVPSAYPERAFGQEASSSRPARAGALASAGLAALAGQVRRRGRHRGGR